MNLVPDHDDTRIKIEGFGSGGRFELYSTHPIQAAAVPASLKAT